MNNKVSIKKTSQGNYKWVVHYPDGGTRKRAFFAKKTGNDGAEQWMESKITELKELGSKELSISNEERGAVIKWRKLVSELPEHAQDVSLSDCVEQFAKTLTTRNKAITCQTVADDLMSRLNAAGRSKGHQNTTRYRLNHFLNVYGDWLACDISTEIIDEYLQDSQMRVCNQTVKHYRQTLYQLFVRAMETNACPSNPVEKAIRPSVISKEAGICTPQEVADLLSCADERIVPALAISFFAGVRRSEIEKLDWSQIKLDQGFITITAGNAKTAQRRNVSISDNLMEWLKPYAQKKGKVVSSPAIYRFEQVKATDKAKIKWLHNAGRHSFASYHLALHEDAGKTAKQLGHMNSELLYRHYHTLVSKQDSTSYWDITPLNQSEKVIQITA